MRRLLITLTLLLFASCGGPELELEPEPLYTGIDPGTYKVEITTTEDECDYFPPEILSRWKFEELDNGGLKATIMYDITLFSGPDRSFFQGTMPVEDGECGATIRIRLCLDKTEGGFEGESETALGTDACGGCRFYADLVGTLETTQ